MVLTIISHTPHFQKDDEIYSWGPTLRELNSLTRLFSIIYHIAPLHNNHITSGYTQIDNKKIRFVPLKPAGGDSLIDKLDILLKMPNNLITIHKYCDQSDWIQFRAPTNLGIYVLPYLSYFSSKNRWVKYAGSWGKKDGSVFYRLQREWLSNNIQKCQVTINGKWINQKKHCLSFENPCLTDEELNFSKIISKEKKYDNSLKICFVGHLESNKGLEKLLLALKLDFTKLNYEKVYIAGDGSKKEYYLELAKTISSVSIDFLGEVNKSSLNKIYEKCHLLVLPSNSEGFPKVIAEAGAYGCVPVVSKVGAINHYINADNGYLLNQNNPKVLYEILLMISKDRKNLKLKASNIAQLSGSFSFEKYNKSINNLILNTK